MTKRQILCFGSLFVNNRIAVIDEDIRGWAKKHEEELRGTYSDLLKAGKNGDLPELSSDPLIASYCKHKKFDLFTADKKSYTHYFSSDKCPIQIREYGFEESGKKTIFLIQVLD